MLTKFQPLLSYEFRRFRGKSKLALIFIVLLPFLYAGVYLGANWDLYAHVDQLQVAVVNQDVPATFDGKTVNGGDEFEAALKENPSFDWQFLGTDEERANKGLRDGKYFMVVTVPPDFSANLVSVAGDHPTRATLRLHRDGGNGFVAGTVMGKADDILGKSLDNAVDETYFRALLINVERGRADLVKAADGSKQLDDGLAQAAAGVHTMDTQVAAAVKDASDTQTTMNELQPAIGQVQGGIAKISGGADTAMLGAQQLSGSAGQLAGQAEALNQASKPLGDFINTDVPAALANNNTILTASGQIGDGPGGSTVTINGQVSTANNALNALLLTHPELVNDPNVATMQKQFSGITEQTTTINSNVHKIGQASAGINVNLNTTNLKRSTEAFGTANDNIAKTVSGMQTGLDTVNKGIGQAREGTTEVQTGTDTITSKATELVGKAGAAVNGITQLSEGLGRLDTAMPALSSGAHQLADGLATGVGKIPVLSPDQQDNLASVMSTPVDTVAQVDNDPLVYGRGMAPMFFSLSLWISCISSFLVVRTMSGRAVTARSNTWRSVLVGFGPLAAVGILSALVMGGGVWLFFGLDPKHPWLFLLLLVVSEVSFMALAYWLRLLFGSPQTAVFLVLLVIQLVAAGGVFPVVMTPKFFQVFSYIAPMRFSVDAFRVAISGGSAAIYWRSIGALMVWLIASMAIVFALVHKRKRFRMRDLHPPMVTSSSTADYAFSVRPR